MLDRLGKAARKIHAGVRSHWRPLGAVLLSVSVSLVAFLLFIVVSYAGTFSINAIVETSTTLLTVEGFLLGLSPLIRSRARFAPITLGILAIMSSLITISVGQALFALQTLNPRQVYLVTTPFILGLSTYQYYVITVALFMFMLTTYWGSAIGTKRRGWDDNWPE
ncbi:MAG TPA: hypothetical protein VNW25_01035 [Candidatus Sulfotelmatobacter sp.]|jgi:hypothetical protein|nr:hypothetical protein [Candidatus Sulfotelmatobacter sp.]